MADKTIEDIIKGKGLQPIPDDSKNNDRPGITTEQRSEKGITCETFSYDNPKKTDKNNQ